MAFDLSTATPVDDESAATAVSEPPTKESRFKLAEAVPVEETGFDVPAIGPTGQVTMPGQVDYVPPRELGVGEQVVGAGESALMLGTGALGGAAGMVGGFFEGLAEAILSGKFGTQEVSDMVEQKALQRAGQLTYEPRTEAGQRQMGVIGEAAPILDPLTGLTPQLAPISQAARTSAQVARRVLPGAVERRSSVPPPRAETAAKPGFPIEETPFRREQREAAGFDVAEFDAQDLKRVLEEDTGEPLVWNEGRYQRLKQTVEGGQALDDYPVAGAMEGRAGIQDGRHRIALAAERGETIRVQESPEALAELRQRIEAERPTPADPTTPEAPPTRSLEELSEKARQASRLGVRRGRAQRILAEEARPDPETVAAAERLGVADYLQADHVTTNQTFRELSQAVKSVPGSEAKAFELEGLTQVGARASRLIEELGGTDDLSMVDIKVRDRLSAIQSQLEERSTALFDEVNARIPAQQPTPAPGFIEWAMAYADDRGGVAKLPGEVRSILRLVSPDEDGTQPTWTLVDETRKSLTAARVKKEGKFKDAESALIKKMESKLLDDQFAVAGNLAPETADLFRTARQTVAMRKGIEDDLKSIFGKHLNGSLLSSLDTAVKVLPKGDVSKFTELLKRIPEDMRQEVTASGLATAFGFSAKRGELSFSSFADWYRNVKRNSRAHNALMANLPKEARQSLEDLYRVSDGIRKAQREFIATGRLQVVKDIINGTDSLIGGLYDFARRASGGAPAEAVSTAMGAPGAGLAAGIAGAMAKGKAKPMKAVDALIASPEFNDAVKSAANPERAAAKLAKSGAFRRFVRAVDTPSELENPEQWILATMQMQRNEEEPAQ